jgi:AraC-like DNA-binding protein
MPLYMDLHKIPKITIAEAKKAHVADEVIQQKYGVKYLQFWVNEEAGNLFCLVEGPDRQTVETVHRLAHGHVACAVVEVDPSYYSLVMGDNIRIDQGLVHRQTGEVDLGNRSILVASVDTGQSGSDKAKGQKARSLVQAEIAKYSGRSLPVTGNDHLAGAFDSAQQALQSATSIAKQVSAANKKQKGSRLKFRIGLSAGQPVTENNEFIAETVRLARGLCQVASGNTIMTSSLFQELSGAVDGVAKKNIKALSASEESFLNALLAVIDKRLFEEDFSIESLGREIGISRPQLYRKIQTLAGRSPNDLIRDLRLDRSLYLLKKRSGNVSEVAFQVGFNNPSYFAKCFARKFGCLPSEIAK